MAEIQGVFKRIEKKYLLDKTQYQTLNDSLQKYMQADSYGKHTICNIYYDTPDYQLIRASLDKPVYKEKLRLRSYGIPTADSTVFIELKKKFKGIVYKRRVPLTLSHATHYLSGGKLSQSCQILQEIDWFMKFYNPQPAAFIGYDRIALFGTENPDLRVTFDTAIRWRDTSLNLSAGDSGRLLLPKDVYLMEIKIPGAMPIWMSHMLDEMEIFPSSFSKYGYCYTHNLARGVSTGDTNSFILPKKYKVG
ncbi:MAG: polyphosphate polymerase domain-containing protein [Oscillospiraceae bacterium]|nr:polyphosphate polymerase domain-containing protein [Oscillospiraceae bacterium]